jgi:hypothetical protein
MDNILPKFTKIDNIKIIKNKTYYTSKNYFRDIIDPDKTNYLTDIKDIIPNNFYLYNGKIQYKYLLHIINKYYLNIVKTIQRYICVKDIQNHIISYLFENKDIMILNHIILFLSNCLNLNFELGFTHFREFLHNNDTLHFLNKYIFVRDKFHKDQKNKKNYLDILTTIKLHIDYFQECNFILENNSIKNTIQELILKEKNTNTFYYEDYVKITYIRFIYESFKIHEILIYFCDFYNDLFYICNKDIFNITHFLVCSM